MKPRKVPTQERAVATVDALVEGCARVLREQGIAKATTNRIAVAAGVGIGSLYEYFPNKDAIVYALALKRLRSLRALIADSVEGQRAATSGQLLRHVAEAVAADTELFDLLLRGPPRLQRDPEIRRIFLETAQWISDGAERAGDRVDLRDPPADLWLLTRMLSHTVLEIAREGGRRGAPSRERLVAELVRLTQRMLLPQAT